MYTQKSFSAKKEEIEKKWWIIDATDLVVGKLAVEATNILRGKNKPTFTPNQECGDYLVITNCEKVKFTGNKWADKKYYWHTNHVGGLKSRTAKEQLERHPEKIIMNAVKGMLPKTSLGRKQLTKLKVVVGSEHSYDAQKPQALTIK